MKLRVRKHDVQINNRALGNRSDALYVALNRTDPSGNAPRSTVQNENLVSKFITRFVQGLRPSNV